MNLRPLLLFIGSVLLPLGCGDSDDSVGPTEPLVLEPSELCSAYPDTAIATFEDANLEAAVRTALSVGAQGDLTCGLIAGLTVLGADSLGITSLVGVQNFTGLIDLNLGDNSISDIDPLSGLTSLTFVRLDNNPNLADIQPLLDNTGLGAGDRVYLESTDVSCTDVAARWRPKG
jgi:hypothetical protein